MPNEIQVIKVPIDQMIVDRKFQRPLNERFVVKIVDDYDPKQLGVIVCNRRWDGTYSVVDGQHRLEAMKRKGRKQLTAVVFEVDAQDEGAIFNALQKNRRAVTPIESHHALVFSKDPDAMALDRITRNAGFRIQTDSVSCIGTLRKHIERGWALNNYKRALDTIRETWGVNDRNATKMEIVVGTFFFFERADIKATTEQAVEAFLDLDLRVVIREAKIIDSERANVSRAGGVAMVLADTYNKYHRLKGPNKIDAELFTASYRTKLGHRTLKQSGKVNTGQFGSHRFETAGALTSGEES